MSKPFHKYEFKMFKHLLNVFNINSLTTVIILDAIHRPVFY
jgi:hypothetical protein